MPKQALVAVANESVEGMTAEEHAVARKHNSNLQMRSFSMQRILSERQIKYQFDLLAECYSLMYERLNNASLQPMRFGNLEAVLNAILVCRVEQLGFSNASAITEYWLNAYGATALHKGLQKIPFMGRSLREGVENSRKRHLFRYELFHRNLKQLDEKYRITVDDLLTVFLESDLFDIGVEIGPSKPGESEPHGLLMATLIVWSTCESATLRRWEKKVRLLGCANWWEKVFAPDDSNICAREQGSTDDQAWFKTMCFLRTSEGRAVAGKVNAAIKTMFLLSSDNLSQHA